MNTNYNKSLMQEIRLNKYNVYVKNKIKIKINYQFFFFLKSQTSYIEY